MKTVLFAAGGAGACVVALAAAAATVRRASVSARRSTRRRIDVASLVRTAPPLRRRAEARADRAVPGALESAARALRSGAHLSAALADAMPVSPPLLRNEWRRMVATAEDRGVRAAVAQWRERRPSQAVVLTAAALIVADTLGGPQARALDRVAATLRARAVLDAEVAALAAQSKASALVIAAAPLFFAVVAGSLEPAYVGFLLGTPPGLLMLVAGLTLQGVGLAWMSRITASVR